MLAALPKCNVSGVRARSRTTTTVVQRYDLQTHGADAGQPIVPPPVFSLKTDGFTALNVWHQVLGEKFLPRLD